MPVFSLAGMAIKEELAHVCTCKSAMLSEGVDAVVLLQHSENGAEVWCVIT